MRVSRGPLSDAARNLAQLRHSPASWFWCAAVVSVQGLVSAVGGVDRASGWYYALGLSRVGFFSGKVWELGTYGLLSGAWWHALLNAVFVLLIGSRVEHIAGRRTMMKVVLLGVFGGGAGHLLLGSGLLVGLSGGCIALLMFLTTLSPESRMFPLPLSGRSLGLGIMIAELVLALTDFTLGLPMFSELRHSLGEDVMGVCFRMGHACHFGGGLAGWICGRWLLRPRVGIEQLRRERARREARRA